MSLDPERTQNDETPKKPGYALNDSMRSMKSAWLKGQKMVDQSFSFVGNGRFSDQPSDHSSLMSGTCPIRYPGRLEPANTPTRPSTSTGL